MAESKQFEHVLVPGGKEAQDFESPVNVAPVLTTEATIQDDHFEDMDERRHFSWSTSKWGSKRNDRPPLGGPPDNIAPRIDSISFSCQECNRTLSLPSEKAKTIMDEGEVEIDCPYCGQHYPFNYHLAQKKTLRVSFRGVTGEKWEDKPVEQKFTEEIYRQEATQLIEPEPFPSPEAIAIAKISTPEPSVLTEIPPPDKSALASLREDPVGETAKVIKNSSKVIVNTLMNNRIFQTVASRVQPNSASFMTEVSTIGQYEHVLVPGGKEGESMTQVIPDVPNKWAPPTSNAPLSTPNGTFEDMSEWLTPTGSSRQANIIITSKTVISVPDRLAVEIEGFTFQCDSCAASIQLPWSAVQTGIDSNPFPVDCSNCHTLISFNYNQARRKTLTLRFKPFFELANMEGTSTLSQQPIPTLSPLVIIDSPTTAIQTTTSARYSPGLEYDRAILEKG